jgi:hypothetical protein
VAVTAAEQGVLVLRGGCVPLGEEGVPFAPVTEALRGLARALDPDELEAVAGPARAELARLVPDLAWGDGEAVRPAVGGAGQGRLFELLLGMVERLAARGLLLIMEGLRWADRSTRDLVAFLATCLRNGPVLVLLTFRSDELHRLHPLRGLLGELARSRRVRRLEAVLRLVLHEPVGPGEPTAGLRQLPLAPQVECQPERAPRGPPGLPGLGMQLLGALQRPQAVLDPADPAGAGS